LCGVGGARSGKHNGGVFMTKQYETPLEFKLLKKLKKT
jgi:hypothetical protein